MIKMVYCYGCRKVYFEREIGITFHNFPRDPKRKKVWEEQVLQENVPLNAVICSNHFTPDCFEKNVFGFTCLKPTALPTIFNYPPNKETWTKSKDCPGPSGFSNPNCQWTVTAANGQAYDVQTPADTFNNRVAFQYKERESLKRKIASQTKFLEELQIYKSSDADSLASGRKRLLTNLEEGSSSKNLKTSKGRSVAPTTQAENTKVPEEEDIAIELESIVEVENAKIKTEPVDSELPNLTQKYVNPSDGAILGASQQSRCNMVQKFPDPSDNTIFGVPKELRSDVVQKCPNSSEAILGVPQKCPDPSNDAILGVPVDYLPIPSRDISEKLDHNQSTASGSATSVPLARHNDTATTSKKTSPLILMLVPSATAIPISKNSSAGNLVSAETLSDEKSISKKRKKDEFDLFGEFVARKLRSMDLSKAHHLQTRFGDLLLKVETGELNMGSVKKWVNDI